MKKRRVIGPQISERDVKTFERVFEVALPRQLHWFLAHVCNGAHFGGTLVLPVAAESGEPGVGVNGLYGINVPSESYDLASVLDLYRDPISEGYFPIGYDEGSGPIFLDGNDERPGVLVWVPWDEYCKIGVASPYKIEIDMEQFGKMVESALLSRFEYMIRRVSLVLRFIQVRPE